MPHVPVFVVTTGRTGSTMLSEMLRDHPEVLSLSEVWSSLGSRALSDRVLDGSTFLARMTRPGPFARALFRDAKTVSEVVYEPGRHGDVSLADVPPLALAALPFLDERPLAVLAEIAPLLRARPRDRLENHIRFLFAWLTVRFNKSLWVERSGGSLLLVGRLAEMFPDARFVHLYRDGRDVACSMAAHAYFRARVNYYRLLGALGIDAFRPGQAYGVARWHVWLEAAAIAMIPNRLVVEPTVGVPACALHWDRETQAGLRILDALGHARVLHVSHEKLVRAPNDVLRDLADFIGVEAPDDWLVGAAARTEVRAAKWGHLKADQIQALEAACGDSLARLGYQ